MNGPKIFFIFFLSLVINSTSNAYILSVNNSEKKIKWPNSSGQVRFHFNPSNGWGVSNATAVTYFQNAVDEWDSVTSLQMSGQTMSGGLRNGRNDIVFSNDSNYFNGSGVAGVTVTVSQDDGDLLEADILIKDSNVFGGGIDDILTHEIGHAIGLDHTQVHRASMFYELNKFQDSLHTDDIAGSQYHYPALGNRGILKGKVIGGPNITPVLGAHVQAISEKTGEVYASAISQEDGTFRIRGLPKDDQYYIYTSPLKVISSLPDVYGDVKADFCESRADYRGGFYQTCRTREEGFPQAINFEGSSTASAGHISIQCSIDSPTDYLSSKGGTYEVDLLDEGGVGETFVGYFTSREAEDSVRDELAIDLTDYQAPGDDHYLEVTFSSEDFFSPLKMDVEAFRNGMSEGNFPPPLEKDGNGVHYSEQGAPTTDVVVRLPLNETNPLANSFTLEVTPTRLKDFLIPGVIDMQDYFPSGGVFEARSYFYLFQSKIVEKLGPGNFRVVSDKDFSVGDNRQCPEASETYRVASKTYQGVSSTPSRESGEETRLPVACGNISDISGGGGGQGGSALLTLFGLAFIMVLRCKRKFYELS